MLILHIYIFFKYVALRSQTEPPTAKSTSQGIKHDLFPTVLKVTPSDTDWKGH